MTPKRYTPAHDDSVIELPVIPMIDIVFTILLFFLVCTTVARIADDDYVVLPDAKSARNDIDPEIQRLVIDVASQNDERTNSPYIVCGSPRSVPDLERLIRTEAENTKYGNFRSSRTVLLRVDHRAEFKYAQELMLLCTRHGLWQLSFGARGSDENS
jgi:biopolymer transport protein ExbD